MWGVCILGSIGVWSVCTLKCVRICVGLNRCVLVCGECVSLHKTLRECLFISTWKVGCVCIPVPEWSVPVCVRICVCVYISVYLCGSAPLQLGWAQAL